MRALGEVLPDLERRLYLPLTGNEKGCWSLRSEDRLFDYPSLFLSSKRANVSAHVFMFETFHGPRSLNSVVDHVCENKSCVHPDHLEAVTTAENVQRSVPGRRSRA